MIDGYGGGGWWPGVVCGMRRLFGGVRHEGWGEEGYPETDDASWGCLLTGMTGGQSGKTGQGGEGRGEYCTDVWFAPFYRRGGAERTWG